MKLEEYKNSMNQIKVSEEKKEELWDGLIRERTRKERRKKRIFVSTPAWITVGMVTAVCVFLLMNRSITLAEYSPNGILQQLQEFFQGLLTTEDNHIVNQDDYSMTDLVEQNVYYDENSHVRMEVLEKLSDGVTVLLTVRYTGLDEEGIQWLATNTENGFIEQNTWIMPMFPDNDLETYGVNYTATIRCLQEMNTVTERYFYIEMRAASGEYKSDRVVFQYRMPEDGDRFLISSPREVELDAGTDAVDVIVYDIADKGEYPGYELRRLYVSGLSYVIYGKENEEYEKPEETNPQLQPEIGLICQMDGTEYFLTNTNFAGSPAAPREENQYSDIVIQGGVFYETEESARIKTFNPNSLTKLVFYDESGEHICDLIKREE